MPPPPPRQLTSRYGGTYHCRRRPAVAHPTKRSRAPASSARPCAPQPTVLPDPSSAPPCAPHWTGSKPSVAPQLSVSVSPTPHATPRSYLPASTPPQKHSPA